MLRGTHEAAWQRLWQQGELRVPGAVGRILRLHLFHLLQTLSPHTAALDVGVPARGLHGEAYRGRVFWDELFVLPYLRLHFPAVAQPLLLYRSRRLPTARAAARRAELRERLPLADLELSRWEEAFRGRFRKSRRCFGASVKPA